jgi:mannose-6-phosphate isomerase-like protein (cupin superfamily)
MGISARYAMGLLVSAFTLAGGGYASPAMAQDKAQAGSGKASVQVLFDDDRIRAFEVTYRPGDQSNTGYKKLPLRIVRAMTSGTLQRTYPDGRTEKVDIVAGEVRVFDAGNQYSGKNIGTTVLVLYGVTPKQPKKAM